MRLCYQPQWASVFTAWLWKFLLVVRAAAHTFYSGWVREGEKADWRYGRRSTDCFSNEKMDLSPFSLPSHPNNFGNRLTPLTTSILFPAFMIPQILADTPDLSGCPEANLCSSPHFEKHLTEVGTEKGQGWGYSMLKTLAWKRWGQHRGSNGNSWTTLLPLSRGFQVSWAVLSSCGLPLH